MHFWTVSLGKGSIIFWGLGMMMYGLSQLKTRKIHLLLGLLIIYHVRPHVFLFMAVGIVVGLFTGRQKVPLYQKLLVFGASIGAMVLLYDKIMAFSKIDGDNVMQSFNQFSAVRAYELSKAGSGIDISNYPLPLKLFTFWFRPLFVDAPGAMGLVVSVENMFYLALAAKLFQKGFIKFLRKELSLIKDKRSSIYSHFLCLVEYNVEHGYHHQAKKYDHVFPVLRYPHVPGLQKRSTGNEAATCNGKKQDARTTC